MSKLILSCRNVLAAALVAVSAALFAAPSFADEAQVRTDAGKWDAAFNAGDIKALSGFYADNARVVPAGGKAVSGPEAIGAFFAASLAGAEPMRTGFTAMRFGWTAYIVPFLFIFSPALLLQGDNAWEMAAAVATAIAGVGLVSIGMIGYWFRTISWWMRGLFIVAGVCLLLPSQIGPWAEWTDLFGVGAGVLLVGYELLLRRRQQATA